MDKAIIRVNVYDLTKVNKLFRKTQVGIYHTSVVVNDEFEVYYRFYRKGCTGVDYASNIDEIPSSMNGELYSTYILGKSRYTTEECQKIAKQLSLREEWLSNRYNVLNHNCHAFSLEFCKQIVDLHKLRKFPAFVFKGENVGSILFNNFLSLFINKDDPPYFLSK